jgi:hypothetical protein
VEEAERIEKKGTPILKMPLEILPSDKRPKIFL